MIYILATSFSSGESWIRGFLFGINESIYKFISELYTFLIELAQQGNLIIENTSISDATSKIYSLIGIIMLFRLGMILLRYIADPDKTMDKNGVGSKIISRVITVLALLVLMPTIFTQLYKLQSALFTSSFMTNFFQDSSSINYLKPTAAGVDTEATFTSIPKKSENDSICQYNLDTTTNKTCLKINQLDWNEAKLVSITAYEYYDEDYNFCPSKIIANKTTGKVYLYNATTAKYIQLDDDKVPSELKNPVISCVGTQKNSLLKSFDTVGLQFLIPAYLEETYINYVETSKGLEEPREVRVTESQTGVSLKVMSIEETKYEGNEANYILDKASSTKYFDSDYYGTLGKSLEDYYSFKHPYSITANLNGMINSLALQNDIKGTIFSDTIMMSFITPNSGIKAEDYNDYITEKNKLQYSPEDYKTEENQIKYSVLAKLIKYKDTSGDFFALEYSGVISLIAGIVVMVMLVATIFKVAIRLFKLIMLEIIAPVPVVLYLDPNDKSAAGGSLSKWATAVAWTYLDVFIRILVILFVAMIIGNVNGYLPTIDSASVDNDMLQLFVIFGALMFVTVGPEFILALFGKKYEKGGFNPFAQMKQVAGLGVALGTVGGGVKGLSQGGLKGAAAGLYLGAKGSLMAGDKGQGFGGLSAGRDFVGKSLADGPDSSGGFFQRMAQNTAASALRENANKAYDIAKDFQKNNLTPLKEKFEEYDAAYTSAVTNRDNARARLQSATNEILTQGYAATLEQKQYIEAITNEITGYDLDATASFMDRTKAANDFNAARKNFKVLYNNYTDEVNKVNEKAGKSQTKFQQEKIDPNIKVPDELK